MQSLLLGKETGSIARILTSDNPRKLVNMQLVFRLSSPLCVSLPWSVSASPPARQTACVWSVWSLFACARWSFGPAYMNYDTRLCMTGYSLTRGYLFALN